MSAFLDNYMKYKTQITACGHRTLLWYHL